MDDRSTTLVPLALTPYEMRCAARLGGLTLTLDAKLPDWGAPASELMARYVVPGLRHALHDSFDRAYPLHYPDDTANAAWEVEGPFSYQWMPIWRGTASW